MTIYCGKTQMEGGSDIDRFKNITTPKQAVTTFSATKKTIDILKPEQVIYVIHGAKEKIFWYINKSINNQDKLMHIFLLYIM
jgi:hypothetical protein